MTTIIGAITETGTVIFGADRASGFDGWRVLGTLKAWAHPVRPEDGAPVEGHALLAAAGQSAAAHMIRRRWHLRGLPDPRDGEDCDAWASACAEAITEVLAEATPSLFDNEGGGPVCLLGHGGRLWLLAAQAAVPVWRAQRFAAVGSGGPVATGAMTVLAATERSDAEVAEAVALSVQVACVYDVDSSLGEDAALVLALGLDGALVDVGDLAS